MTDSPESKSQSWWTTLPGILTGLAALVTAVSGLIIAFHQMTNRNAVEETAKHATIGEQPNVRGSSVDSAPSATSGGASTGAAASGGVVELPLPKISEVKLDGGNTVVKILRTEVQPYNAEKRALKFTVRHTNNGHYPANFWSSSYRLLVDDVPQAPTNFLDEVVASSSAKVGDVIFEVPLTVNQVVLQISSGDEKTRIPISITPASH
jgi:hypothetical protein